MTGLPPGVDPEDELEVEWERDENGTAIQVTMSGVTIVIAATHEDRDLVPFLAEALPRVLEAAWAAIDKEES